MKTIYDEALQELKDATTDLTDLEIIHSYDVSKIEKATNNKQKQKQKLLELYKKLYNGCTDYHDYDELKEIQKQIKELEK